MCGYSNPVKPEIVKAKFKAPKNVEYGSLPAWVWVSSLVLLCLALVAFLSTVLG